MSEREFDSKTWIDEHYAGEVDQPTRAFPCTNGRCVAVIERWRGMGDIQCDCGAWYNSFGQRLRDDWQDNRSNWDESVNDLDGFEESQLRNEQ